MALPPLNGYIPPFKPLSNITPFTYRDGLTYLEVLEGMRTYLNTTILEFVNENFTKLGDDFQAEVNRLIADVTEVIEGIENNSAEFQDAVIETLVNDTESLTRVALDTLYANQKTDNATVAGYVTNPGATKTALDNAYAGQETTNEDVAAFVTNPGATKTALDSAYANQTTDNATVAGYVTNPGATKTALDNAYAGQETTDSDVAGFVDNPVSATRVALDALYTGGATPAAGKQLSAFVPITQPFNAGGVGRVISFKHMFGKWLALSVLEDPAEVVDPELFFNVSDDGVFWSSVSIVQDVDYFGDVAYDGTTFVVAAGGNSYTSADGAVFTSHSSTAMSFLTFSPLLAKFVGQKDDNLFTSANGYTWTQDVAGLDSAWPIAYIGLTQSAETPTKIVIPVLGFESWPPVANPVGKFLVNGGSGWTIEESPTPIENRMHHVLEKDGKLYAFLDGELTTSLDGATWTAPETTPNISNVLRVGSMFVGRNSDAYYELVYSSEDGETWSKGLLMASGSNSTPPRPFYLMAAGNGILIGYESGGFGDDQKDLSALIAVEV